MKLRVKDTIHISAVKSDNIVTGEEFEIEDVAGQSLIDRGLADLVTENAEPAAPEKKVEKKAPAAKSKEA